MTVSLGTGVDIGNIVTAETNPLTGGIRKDKKNWPNHENKILLDLYDLAAWTGRGDNAGGGTIATATGSTITEALDLANGAAGGSLITMTKTADDATTKNILTSPYFISSYKENLEPWFLTAELKMPAGQWCTIDLCNEAPSNLIQITIGNGDNQVKVTPYGGSVLTVTGATSGLVQTSWFRILCLVIPTSASTGKVRTYVYHSTGRYFCGETTYSSATVFVSRAKVTQKWTSAGTMYLARPVVARLSGVFTGCSLDAGYFGWNMSPEIARATNIYETARNPAHILAGHFSGALTLHGSTDWWINHAQGGQTVGQMLTDFADYVVAMSPKHVRIGSATNSCMAALSSGDPVAYMTQAKADYLSMVNQAKAIGAQVFCVGVAPRHDTTTVSLGLEAYAALAKDFNAWANANVQCPFYDPWDDLEDPAMPNQLNPLYAGSDNVHWNKYGQRLVGRREWETYEGWPIPNIANSVI